MRATADAIIDQVCAGAGVPRHYLLHDTGRTCATLRGLCADLMHQRAGLAWREIAMRLRYADPTGARVAALRWRVRRPLAGPWLRAIAEMAEAACRQDDAA